jgi:putative ABC transport system permease protein
VRSLLTIFGVASGMFLFTAVETLQHSLAKATEASAADTTLVVYRQNRFCPSASRLPEHYADEIRRIDGVREVVPVQIVVNNCGASLDVVTFRGVPDVLLRKFAPEIEIIDGSEDAWKKRDDGALLGEVFAQRVLGGEFCPLRVEMLGYVLKKRHQRAALAESIEHLLADQRAVRAESGHESLRV